MRKSARANVEERGMYRRLKINAEEIPHMGITETYCYIGTALGPEPSREVKQLETTSIQMLTDMLNNPRLSDASATHVHIASALICGFLHYFTLGKPYQMTLKRCDIQTKRSGRRWLHLPKATTTPYFHATVKAGGLVVMKLQDTMPVLREGRILNVEDSAAHWLAQRLDKSSRDATRACAASTRSTQVPNSGSSQRQLSKPTVQNCGR